MNSLKFFRQDRQFSQIELAMAVNLPRYKIQQHEQGILQLSAAAYERVAAELGLCVQNGKLVERRPLTDSIADEEATS